MAEKITLQLDTSKLESDLRKVEKRGRSLLPAMRTVSVLFKNDVLKNFKEGGRASSDPESPLGGNIRWERLAPATILSRLRKERGGKSIYTKKGVTRKGVLSSVRSMKPLVDDGILKKSITATADNSSAEATTNLVYAPLQNFGGKAGRGRRVTVPARTFMQVQPVTVERSKKILLDYVLKDTKKK